MIVIKDKVMGEVWKIYEPEEYGYGSEKVTRHFVVPLIKATTKYFDTASEAITWVAQQIESRRNHLASPKPATFWNPH